MIKPWVGVLAGIWLAAAPPALGQQAVTIELEIAAGAAVGGAAVARVSQGNWVTIKVTSDKAGELHLHGYDLTIQVAAGETRSPPFVAHATGRFPLEIHEGGHGTLLYLEVYPR